MSRIHQQINIIRVFFYYKKKFYFPGDYFSQLSTVGSLDSSHKDPSVCDATSKRTASSRRALSALSRTSSSSSQYLELPLIDTTTEHQVLSSEEAMIDQRKSDRASLNWTEDKEPVGRDWRIPMIECTNGKTCLIMLCIYYRKSYLNTESCPLHIDSCVINCDDKQQNPL